MCKWRFMSFVSHSCEMPETLPNWQKIKGSTSKLQRKYFVNGKSTEIISMPTNNEIGEIVLTALHLLAFETLKCWWVAIKSPESFLIQEEMKINECQFHLQRMKGWRICRTWSAWRCSRTPGRPRSRRWHKLVRLRKNRKTLAQVCRFEERKASSAECLKVF